MNIEKINIRLKPNPKRVILQFFFPGNIKRAENIIRHISSLQQNIAEQQLGKVLTMFAQRHPKFSESIFENYKRLCKIMSTEISTNVTKQLLIGAYFSKEYSIESAALFNPSIVPHPDQKELAEGELRFVLSLRAAGEGHISSIEFRQGVLDSSGALRFTEQSKFALTPRRLNYRYDKKFLQNYLTEEECKELDADNLLPSEFDEGEFDKIAEKLSFGGKAKDILSANYRCAFSDDSKLSERVLFPGSSAESVGMEDARFVLFRNGSEQTYYATYTAYNGKQIRTQLLQTDDFREFKIRTLRGSKVRDKGFAIFPQKVDGEYCISSRLDGENLYLMRSPNILEWNHAKVTAVPELPWQFVQLGNCGSSILTNDGWLLITHAVGPMRRYVIGALLLDKNDPSKILGGLSEPLLEPDETEREGYVPNVVYSCGSLEHNGNLILPYAMSDSECGFAKIKIEEIMNNL